MKNNFCQGPNVNLVCSTGSWEFEKKLILMANESRLKSNFVIPDLNLLSVIQRSQIPIEVFKFLKLSDDLISSSNLSSTLGPSILGCSKRFKVKFAFLTNSKKCSNNFSLVDHQSAMVRYLDTLMFFSPILGVDIVLFFGLLWRSFIKFEWAWNVL